MTRKRKSTSKDKGQKKPRIDAVSDLFWAIDRDPEDEACDPKPKGLLEWNKMPRVAFFEWRGQVFRHGDEYVPLASTFHVP